MDLALFAWGLACKIKEDRLDEKASLQGKGHLIWPLFG